MSDLKVGDKVRRVLPDSLGIWFGIGEVKSVKRCYGFSVGEGVVDSDSFVYSVLFNNEEIHGIEIQQLEKVGG